MKERSMKKALIGRVVLSILVFTICLAAPQGRAQEARVSTFGEGKITARLYTDYFCAPCNDMEPRIEPIVTELERDKIIKLTFIDTPFNRYSSLYARYFLYAMNEKKTLDNALFVRRALIEAAAKRIVDAQKLEAFLNEKKIAFRPFDVKPVFNMLSAYLKQDEIDRTPTCVIEMNGKTYKHNGTSDITAALETLRQKKSPK
jgi:hypothetical protein